MNMNVVNNNKNNVNNVKRIFVEKKKEFNIEGQALYRDFKYNLGIKGLTNVRIVNRYDVEGISDEDYRASRNTIFSEPPVDIVYDEVFSTGENEKVFAVEYLPGQYDQRADSASQCIQILTRGERPVCRTAKLFIIEGDVSDIEYEKIRNYCINPVECREASLGKPSTLEMVVDAPEDVSILQGFINMTDEELESLIDNMGLAMSFEDLEFCRNYFRDIEKRDPTVTEVRIIDTYWSDHCRHTTFLKEIKDIEIKDGRYTVPIKSAFDSYISSRKFVYENRKKDICLMDIAIIAMKELKKRNLLNDLDESDEINACSIEVKVDVNGRNEDWLVMFKNETHNHPTEIEPFGGAATCLGGAIRDPLSGRSYVYQAMRVTGSGDPRTPVEDTLPGKLPQRKITTGAAAGYSSYGNQIGIATGQVVEIYDEDYVAKRMEIGAVIGAAPKNNVLREKPVPDDIVILLGGRTGRDGCGGATGSSKEHSKESLVNCGAEVQKGNPPTERKIQRLFRNPEVSALIKKCNDFGAGGVMVAIGELADGIEINLDAVPRKYEGLNGTELAISESQERMAVVVSPQNVNKFIAAAAEENLEATPVAVVTEVPELKMRWRGKLIVDIDREFLNSNGAKRETTAVIASPVEDKNFFRIQAGSQERMEDEPLQAKSSKSRDDIQDNIKSTWLNNLGRLNVCSQKGLVERFDSTIGAGTVLMPFGGKYQLSPSEGMVAKIPVLDGDTCTGTVMTFGYNPQLAKWSPFHGAVFAVLEAISKIAAIGGNYKNARLSLQEYFEKLGKNPEKWGQPLSALLGAYYAQIKLGIPAIGGKDSMSGTFRSVLSDISGDISEITEEMNVPPTLVAFAVSVIDVNHVISSEFKKAGSKVVMLHIDRDINEMPDFEQLDKNYTRIHELIAYDKILASAAVKTGGIAETISKMCFGNMIGFKFEGHVEKELLFNPEYGSIILEIPEREDLDILFQGLKYHVLGHTAEKPEINVNVNVSGNGSEIGSEIGNGSNNVSVSKVAISLEEALQRWQEPLEGIFPTKVEAKFPTKGSGTLPTKAAGTFPEKLDWNYNLKDNLNYNNCNKIKSTRTLKIVRPRIFIPVFPGTNCEYDAKKAFEKAGGFADVMVIRNLTSKDIEESIEMMAKKIDNSQVIMIPGGFSGGDEPDGSGKFIATAFRNPRVKDAVMRLLKERDGLVLGICNGFQALIKLGLVPYGEIRDMTDESPTLTFNTIGRHASCMVYTKIVSNLSPWLSNVKQGEMHTIAISHGEGRFVASQSDLALMERNGQIATCYVDPAGNPTYDIRFNPNGSVMAIEGITSPDGRVFGKMGHSERIGKNVVKNVPGEKDQKIFDAGIEYFR